MKPFKCLRICDVRILQWYKLYRKLNVYMKQCRPTYRTICEVYIIVAIFIVYHF